MSARRLFAFTAISWLASVLPGLAAVAAPVLKWSYGGCISGPYCQTGWYSSPAVADLDGDGQPDVVWGAYDVVSLNGATGSLKWRATNPQRVWPGVVIADLTGDGNLEVVVGRGGDQLTVYNRFGTPLWTRNPFGSGEVRTLAVADLEGDGTLEIVVGRASGGDTKQLSVYEPDGSVRPGWPARRDGEPGYGWGMYNENVAVADMNGDGLKEVFGPTDTHYITALDRNGNQLPANAIYGAGKVWSQVGVHVDHAVDLRGYANCGVEHRPNFADSAPAFADVNGDGTREWIVVGNVYNCANPYTSLYHMPFLLRLDRTRWSGSGFDWTAIPVPGPGSGPRSEDYTVIETAVPNPVAADLDGDGKLEILFPSYDGKLHAYWLDKTEHGSWPYVVPSTGGADNFRFASEPVVADLDNDGQAEVIFTSWPKKGTGGVGHLHILSSMGVELHRVPLPAPAIGATWNGGLGAPTLANIDADPDLEVVVGTVASGVVAYDLPGTASARVLWGTGRGSYRRTGGIEQPSSLTIDDVAVTEGNVGTTNAVFTVRLSAPSDQPVTVNYATAPGTATAGSDYTSTSGALTFPVGTTTRTVTVPVVGDLLDEANETFFVNLWGASGALVADAQGMGTITDNDPLPVLSIDDFSGREGNTGTTIAGFTVSLSAPSGRLVTVGYATADGTAAAGADYTGGAATIVFPPGSTSQPLGVSVLGDRVFEADETFVVNLTSPINATLGSAQGQGTILNDDAAGLSIADLAIVEPVSGTRVARFTVTLSPTSSGTVTVEYSTADVTATSGTDYDMASGTLSFPPGVSTLPVDVTIHADALIEGVETFQVDLANPGGAAIAYGQAIGLIHDPGNYFALTPCRVLDTRNPTGPYGGPALGAGLNRAFTLAGRCGIPASARAVSANVTVTQPTAAGYLTLYPGGAPPLASSVNYSAGQTRANNAVVGLSATGQLSIRCGQASGTAHAILDVTGYFE
jgi:hypothetical protein